MGEYFYKHENKYPKAIECFNNAIIINKTFYKAIYNKGKNNIKIRIHTIKVIIVLGSNYLFWQIGWDFSWIDRWPISKMLGAA